MELLGDLGQIEACFGLFEDRANLGTRQGLGLHRTCNSLKNHFGRT
jgi:hypothetical protein